MEHVLPTEQRYVPLEKIKSMHRQALENPEKFWGEMAKCVEWDKSWDVVLEWDPPFARWYVGGLLNICYNCVDRHINGNNRNKAALIWEGENGTSRTLTFYELYREVNKFASVLLNLGVEKGDRVAIYMPMIPQAVISMLACTRIGAIHTVVFSGFSAEALEDRINDSRAKVVITSDIMYRRGKRISLKSTVDRAVRECPSVNYVVVVKRGHDSEDIRMVNDRDYFWDELMSGASRYVEPERVESTHPSFILYTSGTTGKPKGVVHSTGGYLVYATKTMEWTWGINPRDVFWCTADIGWITGHTYVVYGPLSLGTTTVIYEGAPDYPSPDRFWDIIEKHGITVFYTAPTAIRMLMKYGSEWVKKHDISTLRLLGTVGEPMNPEAWKWYYEVIGDKRCPVCDCYWQTETGGHLIYPPVGVQLLPLKPGSVTFPGIGIDADIVDEQSNSLPPNKKGLLVVRNPWPGMLMTLWNDEERYKAYWSRVPGTYCTMDYAIKDEDGYIWILGRADEVLNVAGHRIGTAEIEHVLVAHPAVSEAAVVGKQDEIKGETPVAFVVLKEGYAPTEELKSGLIHHVKATMGPIATPSILFVVESLPKTRSGKIMRRVLKAVASGKEPGDITTIEDEGSIEEIERAYEEFKGKL
ncbi:MAG: acetyl-CoA synthetase [Methanosarcinales archaeon]|uniref:acetate--CoA ligase n=1 Tax=Methermicoccus shengliensis TaxID=660064 RepID=UPI0005B2BEE4|nr:acetate--CoA ligase [Methermicoccus shengliensis]MDI3487376.1 acetyl-CoA synthetase [Methanosarcinales archaeon]